MKKTITSIVVFLLVVVTLQAQSIAEAVKLLNYSKNKSAKEMLQKMYESNNKDQTIIYWYGQSMIVVDEVEAARKLYQDALNNGVNEPLIWVGMAHVGLLENNDWNAAQQKFEVAITTTTETKGKNKGKPSVAVLNAIGRANCIGHSVKDGSSKFGNVEYAIDKLKQATSIDLTNSEGFIYMGLCYRKMGGEFGGEAQKAYIEAISRDATNPLPHYLIGKIYQSQDNKQFMDQYFNAALAVDLAYAPVYLDYYYYNSDRDVPLAKIYIEKYIQYADKDCHNDYFYADYLFRAGNYQESLAKAMLLENTECKARVPVLYAYNYDRLNDSLKAKKYIEQYLAAAHLDKILISDYDLAISIESRFPGQEAKSIEYINKALEMDSSKNGKLRYLSLASKIYDKAKNYTEQLKVLQKIVDVKGSKSEYDHYILTSTAYKNENYPLTMELAKDYIANFPNKPQGYDFNVRAARKIDTLNNTGLYVDAITEQLKFYKTDTAAYKQQMVNNYYVRMAYFNDTKKDYLKAIEVCDRILDLIPNEPQTMKIRDVLVKNAALSGLKPQADSTLKQQ
jgi:hypothetical protein